MHFVVSFECSLPGEPNVGFPKEWYIHIQTDEEDSTTEGNFSCTNNDIMTLPCYD